ncbi:MAG TPA: sugar ABC transporter permease [Anaerolineaceae bacterium]|nr:sugar ABC transporter permease [Anaerolineaceae bacterium]HPN53827.1 sugar ABC transporter permease [Anaerolineaceae bacterium]
MVSRSGRRKNLTVFFFLAPTLLAVLVFNVYPILLNTYVSFTNRNKVHPNPDCSVALTGLLDPLCWPVFREHAPTGLAEPYTLADPLFKNYTELLGKLFTVDALLALLRVVLVLLPLALAFFYNQRKTRPDLALASPGMVWLYGILLTLLASFFIDLPGAYANLMKTGDFLAVVARSLIFVVIRVPITFAIGFILAVILNSPYIKGRTFFRVVLFLPWAASSLAILMAKVWEFFFRQQGTINQVLAIFGVDGKAWLQDPTTALAAIIIADIWFSYPFFMVTILGALQAISNDVYEAAEMDGASWWHQLFNITLPLIRPAVLPAIVLTSISAFQMFGTAYAITAGGPSMGAGQPGATEFVMIYAYKQIFQSQNYGRATAFAVILFIMLFGATLYSLRVSRATKGANE